MTPEIDIYRNLQTGKCWKVEFNEGERVKLKRGARTETIEREDFDRMFEGEIGRAHV